MNLNSRLTAASFKCTHYSPEALLKKKNKIPFAVHSNEISNGKLAVWNIIMTQIFEQKKKNLDNSDMWDNFSLIKIKSV